MFNEDKFKALKKNVIFIIAVLACLFHLYAGCFGISAIIILRGMHLIFMSSLVFLIYPISQKKSFLLILDFILMAIIITGSLYLIINFKYIALSLGRTLNIQIILGILMIVAVLETTRRVVGNIIPGIALFFLLYAYFGPYFGPLAHKAYSMKRIASQIYLTTEGIFGIPLGISASFVLLFILFGAFLREFGGSEFFFNLASIIGKGRRSGPALTAVVGSSLFGLVSGSAVANVSTTGNVTIPLMKRCGYEPSIAGAIETIASTGGQLMPPVMGAAAFILAELVGISYLTVIKRAFIPAVIYYFALACFVDLYAGHHQIRLMSETKLLTFKEILKSSYTFIIPTALLFYFLIRAYSPARVAVVAIVSIAVVALFFREYRQDFFKRVLRALENGARGSVTVALTCACAGIIVGMVNLTGLGLRLSGFIISLSGGNLLLVLFFVMITSIIMGMGLPTVPAYIIVVIIAVPALIDMGIPAISAHLFILYFSVISNITPPVCLAAYAAAAIAKSNPMETGFKATSCGIVAFLIPYFFIYKPEIMALGSISGVLSTILFIMLGIFALSVFREGYLGKVLNPFERIIYGVISILLFQPISFKINLIGLIIFTVAILFNYRKSFHTIRKIV
jgi:TRAP transporter 4TM/12TM fusion protein